MAEGSGYLISFCVCVTHTLPPSQGLADSRCWRDAQRGVLGELVFTLPHLARGFRGIQQIEPERLASIVQGLHTACEIAAHATSGVAHVPHLLLLEAALSAPDLAGIVPRGGPESWLAEIVTATQERRRRNRSATAGIQRQLGALLGATSTTDALAKLDALAPGGWPDQ